MMPLAVTKVVQRAMDGGVVTLSIEDKPSLGRRLPDLQRLSWTLVRFSWLPLAAQASQASRRAASPIATWSGVLID
jgi:hypothetical protein